MSHQAAATKVIAELLQKLDEYNAVLTRWRASRLYVQHGSFEYEGQVFPPAWVSVTPEYVSRNHDLSDCKDPQAIFYMDENFVFHPVKLGSVIRREANDNALEYADIVANCQVVGSVTFTDH